MESKKKEKKRERNGERQKERQTFKNVELRHLASSAALVSVSMVSFRA